MVFLAKLAVIVLFFYFSKSRGLISALFRNEYDPRVFSFFSRGGQLTKVGWDLHWNVIHWGADRTFVPL